MNRRSFFATLFAPVVAMALPKPKYDPYRLGTWHGNKFTPDMPETFASHGHKIGEAIHVRKPMRFVSSQGRIDVLYGWDAIKHENVIIRVMNRRNFFSMLAAPLVAAILPKPKPTPTPTLTFSLDEFRDQYLRVALERMAQANEEWLLRYCAVGTGWHDTMVIQQEVNHAASMQAECIMLRPTRTKEEIDAAYADLRAEAVQSGILRSNPVL